MGFVRQIAHRVVFTDRGKIVENGAPTQLFENPRTDPPKLLLSQILRRHFGASQTLLARAARPYPATFRKNASERAAASSASRFGNSVNPCAPPG